MKHDRFNPNRRHWLMGAVAGAAALAGAGLAWRRGAPATTLSQAESALWSLQFATPQGATMSMAALRGKPLLLNFWATWCPPCVEELPLLDDFYRTNSANGWQVLGLAVDQVAPVQRFLTQTPLHFQVALAGLSGVEMSRSLGNLSGGLPFTVLFDAEGQIVHRKMGKVTPDDLRTWALLK